MFSDWSLDNFFKSNSDKCHLLTEISYKKTDESEYGWLRMIMSGCEWLQVTASDYDSPLVR